ncbi:phage major capsid protein [uncultured Ruegeria sp.]|uniref:phage major capsid protein n=1 Tax=uncultured Ruegeria sp. TaxID=259304 RepID=UPI0026220305|nr:phage major capsid protein [uncultured Ruegeria sp.]
MLESVKIQRRQSEIRQELTSLSAKEGPDENEIRLMETLDTEYRQNETRYRAALIAEDEERREAGEELETRSDQEWTELVDGFEVRQVAMALDTGHQIDGRTAEVIEELRNRGGYQGLPVPWEALEMRNTVSSGTPDPIQSRPIIDRLFPNSVAAQMGAQMISIDHGDIEWPVTTAGATVGWQATESSDVAAATPFQTTDRAMAPDHTLGVRMTITRKALKKSGAALEQAVRRDMNSAMGVEMDRVVFLGTGADGQPLGVVTGASTYGITETAIDAPADWAAFRTAVARFITRNAATGPGSVNGLIRPELWSFLDGAASDPGSGITEWDRMVARMGNLPMSHNALAAPTGSPLAVSSLLTTSAGGVAPIFCGKYGAVDIVRDPYTDAASGGLRLTALATMDVTVARPAQLEVLTGLELA